jgi:DNA repair exonuclease SbcCD ATPase subunit
VEVEFSIGDLQWKVVRAIKPNIFEIWKDGKCLDQFSNANDQQKWLEQNVIKMNYKSFTQIVILGSSTFVPFMQLTATNRREVIEDLLDIKIFSSMNNLIRDKIKIVRDETRTLDLKKESLNDKVEMQTNWIKELESQSKGRIDGNQQKITTLFTESDDYLSVK